MSFPLTYQAAMTKLAELAQPSQPAHVRLQALTTLVRELSPSNPRHQDVTRALEPKPNPTLPERPLTPGERKELHLHPLADDLPAADQPPDDDEDNPEEDGRPLLIPTGSTLSFWGLVFSQAHHKHAIAALF